MSCLHLQPQRYEYELRDTLDHLRHTLEEREHDLRRCTYFIEPFARVRLRLLRSVRHELEERQCALQERRNRLQQGRAKLESISNACTQLCTESNHKSTELRGVQMRLSKERARLLRELDLIYPIDLVNARDLLYSLVGIPLPNGIATTKANASALVHKTDMGEASTVLSYVAQVALLLSKYLHTPLPYPLTSVGSRATIQDRISVMSGPRSYVRSYIPSR